MPTALIFHFLEVSVVRFVCSSRKFNQIRLRRSTNTLWFDLINWFLLSPILASFDISSDSPGSESHNHKKSQPSTKENEWSELWYLQVNYICYTSHHCGADHFGPALVLDSVSDEFRKFKMTLTNSCHLQLLNESIKLEISVSNENRSLRMSLLQK